MNRTEFSFPEGVRWDPDRAIGDGVLVLAGSSGRIDDQRARVFAGVGCVAESIRWFAGPGQHEGPWEIPLEMFLDRIDALRRDCDRAYVVGASFGAEAALLCGAHSPEVARVIAFAPSDVVWAGFDKTDAETSHWSLGGKSLPYVPLDWSKNVTTSPPEYRRLYEASRETFAERLSAATIPVEHVRRLVLIAGGDDRVWPSVLHAQRIRDRREHHGLPTTTVIDAAAGHRTILPGEEVVIGGATMQRGGTEAADRRLGHSAWHAITGMLTHSRWGMPDALPRRAAWS
jgi:pimeloyl-ACP methyl ester carboxylesterase